MTGNVSSTAAAEESRSALAPVEAIPAKELAAPA